MYAGRDINNVQGDQYIINNPIFKVSNEEDNNGFVLEKIESINYFDELKERLNEKRLVSRASVEEIKTLMTNSDRLLVYGEPGIGKTTIVRELEVSNKIIYISLKDRSIREVLEYLIRCYGLQFDKNEDIFFMLESLMKSSRYLFIFDDCESNSDVIRRLDRLCKCENKFLYLSRNISGFKGIDICKYELKQFTKDEVKEFINLYLGSELEDAFIEELYIKSKGNPLYLYYYVNFSIIPLPIGLESYQQALWESLNSEQKETLSCIAITNFPIKREVLKESLYRITEVKNTLMEFQNKISVIEYLLNSKKGVYDIFHPLFKEYILQYIIESGIINEYEVIVGESAIKKNDIIEGTLLLLDKNNDVINKYLLPVGFELYNYSKIFKALKVLQTALIRYEKDEAYIEYYAHTNYHISILYMDINDKDNGYKCINKAIDIYKNFDDKEGYLLCIIIKAVFFAEEGRKEESEKLLAEIATYEFQDDKLKAYLYINMSKINITFNQYEKAAINAKKAYEHFSNIGNKEGAVKSLLNYSGALSNIDQEELATEYLEMVLNDNEITINKTVKAAIMNNLTSCYRKNKEYDKAIATCNESINIMKELKQYSKLAMNLLNLGNIYRDLEEWDKCESAYMKGIEIAENHSVIREIGRGNELMASMSYMQKKYDDCIKYSQKAIEASNQVNDDFRVAEAYIEMSRGYLALNQIIPYINCIEQAIQYYLKENFVDEAIDYSIKLINYYDRNYNEEKVKEYLEKINMLLNSGKEVDYKLLNYNLAEAFKENESTNIIVDLYYYTIIGILKSENNSDLRQIFNGFIDACKNNINDRIKKIFIDVAKKLVVKGKENNLPMNILAFMLEESGELVEREDLDSIIQDLKECHDDVYIRKSGEMTYVFTVYWNCGVYIQYCCDAAKLINIKVSLALYLITKFNEDYIMEQVKNIECKYIDFNILDFKSVKESIGETEYLSEQNFERIPVVFSNGVTCDVPTYIILGEEYEVKKGKENDIKSDVFIYTIMNIFVQLTKRILNISNDKIDQSSAIEARKFIEHLTCIKLEGESDKWIIQPLNTIN
ncbi:tetratricopeptide repeat protein [Clostridium chrysemydis]|uniref:tetratricopeptide repeat protein n=1 Tax=Clostridium chrysemydis TaxID=2665504 RepID=UPI003F68122E